jgi:hypothetical protein
MSVPLRHKQMIPNETLSVLRQVESADTKMISDSVHDRGGIRIGILVFLISAIYATIRYNVMKDVPWSDWPVYTLNKVFGVSSLLLLVIATARYHLRPTLSNGKILYLSGLFGGIHILISCMLLNPAYYGKFFLDGKLTAIAGFSMLTGAVSAVLFISKAGGRKDRQITQITRSLTVIGGLTGIHLAFQGFQTWMKPYEWPGFIPPLTLVSFLISIVPLVLMIDTKTIKTFFNTLTFPSPEN